ncbi:transcription factor HES-4 [Cherax quadricarinatus]|uniref:transcription factor HES-4 n=1 Tax=Cherax quadricarinatus TaxID=27406 RepID=UPI002378E0E2|nr:transcription factor HES-4-like [Cherax quadricarinatus]
MPSTTAKQGVDAKAAAAERRRTNKPIMEKKRRQRINDSLNQLKNLVLEGLKKDPSRYNKLEKADILEMTVRHVQALHRHELAVTHQPVDAAAKFRTGFGQCAAEVGKFLERDTTLTGSQRSRILLHLAETMARLRNSKLDTAEVSLTLNGSESRRSPHPAPMDPLVINGVSFVPTPLLSGPVQLVLPHGVAGTIACPPGHLHHAPPSPPPSAGSPSLSLMSSPPPSPARSPSPQPLDLAPIRHPEDDSCWRPW